MEFFNSIAEALVILIGVIGWFVVYFLSKRQDAINKQREIRINYLIEAWRNLESSSNRNNNDYLKNIETSIADIQLFGTKKQIELAQKFAIEISENGKADQLELLIELRKDLRKELQLDDVPDKFKFLRVIDRTYDGYMTEIQTIYGQLQHFLDSKIESAPDEWDRLYNVDFFIKIDEKYIGLQIKPVNSGIQLPEIHKEYALQAETHKKFTEKYGGKVFYIFSEKINGKKEIVNKEVIEEIRTEINKLRNSESK